MPTAPPVVYTPPSAGSPPAAPGAVYTPPSAGSPPAAPGAVLAPGGSIPQFLKITGITDPEDAEELILERMADIGGLPAWTTKAPVAEWTVTPTGTGAWNLTENDDGFYSAISPAGASPVGLTGWTVETGAGQPSIAAYLPPPPAITA